MEFISKLLVKVCVIRPFANEQKPNKKLIYHVALKIDNSCQLYLSQTLLTTDIDLSCCSIKSDHVFT